MAYSKRWAATIAGSPERFGITLVRLIVGVVFIMHGWAKWTSVDKTLGFFHSLGLSTPMAYTAMSAELGCGILLVLGLFTRLAAIPIIVTMIVAIMKVHINKGFFSMNGGYEFALTMGVSALALLLAGPGTLAADNLLAGKH